MDTNARFAVDGMSPTDDLAVIPTYVQYRKVMGPFWNYSINTILYLREFEIGFRAAAFLLRMTEYYKFQLTPKEYQINKYMIWYFYLRLLDKSDHWDELIATLEELRKDLGIKLPDEMYPHTGSFHITEHLHWQERRRIVQKKINRKKEGKSVGHLRHAQFDEMSEDEYNRRIEVLKLWFERGQVEETLMRKANKERNKYRK